jgi:hypothetical protein
MPPVFNLAALFFVALSLFYKAFVAPKLAGKKTDALRIGNSRSL